MSAWIVALLFSVGASTWIYTKLQKYTGAGNPKQTVFATIGAFIFIFFISYFIFNLFL